MKEHTASLASKIEFTRREFVVEGLAKAGLAWLCSRHKHNL